MTAEAFRAWKTKRITLLGMSGIGKTRIASLLPPANWFHYSGDYRIGSHYLDEAIIDNLRLQMMQVPFLATLLRTDSIYIKNNLTFHDLSPISSFLGKVGNPELGGLAYPEFIRRQQLHHEAEVQAMLDVPHFIDKARQIYNYSHFINDAGGSICELNDTRAMQCLIKHTLILYIQATKDDEVRLIHQAITSPKPLYYRPEFLQNALDNYLKERNLDYIACVDPDDFTRWVFPHLFHSRLPRYGAIAKEHGYTLTSNEVMQANSEDDFIALIASAIERKTH